MTEGNGDNQCMELTNIYLVLTRKLTLCVLCCLLSSFFANRGHADARSRKTPEATAPEEAQTNGCGGVTDGD